MLEDDPLLQLDFDWEEEEQTVEDQLAQMRLELQAAQKVVNGVLGDDEPVEVKRDDDTHYFDSYEENGTSKVARLIRYPRNHAPRHDTDSVVCKIHPLERQNKGRGRHGCWLRHGNPIK